MFVYIAGPITKGNQFYNLRNALQAADEVMCAGHTPFVPHLTCVWDMMFSHEYEEWMEFDDKWLGKCDTVLRIEGESAGADREVERAKQRGIPVYYSLVDLLRGA